MVVHALMTPGEYDGELAAILTDTGVSGILKRWAIETIWRKFSAPLERWLQKMTSMDVASIVSEVLVIRIVPISRQFDSAKGTFRAYLWAVAFNELRSLLRRRSEQMYPLRVGQGLQLVDTRFPGPGRELENAEIVADYLQGLDPLEAAVFTLRVLDGRAPGEVARMLRLTVAQVYRLQFQASEKLRLRVLDQAYYAGIPTDDPRAPSLLDWVAQKEKPRTPVTLRPAACASREVVQRLDGTKNGLILGALTAFLRWRKTRHNRWRLSITFYARRNNPNGCPEDLLRKLSGGIMRVERVPAVSGFQKTGSREGRLLLDSSGHLQWDVEDDWQMSDPSQPSDVNLLLVSWGH